MTNDLVLNTETCNNLLNMIYSPDKENWTVVEQLLNHIDIESNLPYILMLYKESTAELRKEIFTDNVIKRLEAVCNFCTFQNRTQITYQAIYDEIKSKQVSKESMEFFIDKFSISLRNAMMNWGYSFLSDFEMKLKLIK